MRLQSRRERRAIDDCSADLTQLEFEESVPCNFSYQIERTEQRYPIFDQGSQRTRKLCVVTVSDDPAVSGNHQLETIPTDASFIAANKRAETDDCANRYQHANPPVTRNRMIKL